MRIKEKNTTKKIFVYLMAFAIVFSFENIAFANGGAGAGGDFFGKAIDALATVVKLIGGGLGAWGIVNLLEGYGNDNPGANAHVR